MSDLLDLYPYLGGLILSAQRPLSNRPLPMPAQPVEDELNSDPSIPSESENNIIDITQNVDLDQKSQTSPDDGFSRKESKRRNSNIDFSDDVPEQDNLRNSNGELDTRIVSKQVTQSKTHIKQTQIDSNLPNTNSSQKNTISEAPKNAGSHNSESSFFHPQSAVDRPSNVESPSSRPTQNISKPKQIARSEAGQKPPSKTRLKPTQLKSNLPNTNSSQKNTISDALKTAETHNSESSISHPQSDIDGPPKAETPSSGPTQNNSKSGQTPKTRETQQTSANINNVDHQLKGSISQILDEEPDTSRIRKSEYITKQSVTHVSDFKDRTLNTPSDDKHIEQTVSQSFETDKATIDKTERRLRSRPTRVEAHQQKADFQSDKLTSPVNAKRVVSQERDDRAFELEKQKPLKPESTATSRSEARTRQGSQLRQSTKKQIEVVGSTVSKSQRIPSLYAGLSNVTKLVDKASTPAKSHTVKSNNRREDIDVRASHSNQKPIKRSPQNIQAPISRPQKRHSVSDKAKAAKLQIGQVNLVVKSTSKTPPSTVPKHVVEKPREKPITARPMPFQNRKYRKRF